MRSATYSVFQHLKRGHYMKNTPDTLYHYTSIHGLEGIIDDGKIRATNIFYLNDQSEFYHPLEFIINTLKQFKLTDSTTNEEAEKSKTTTTDKDKKELITKKAEVEIDSITLKALEKLCSILQEIYSLQSQQSQQSQHSNTVDIYNCSFTNDGGNSLSQWRGYCKKGGFSIGFKFEDLQETINNHKEHQQATQNLHLSPRLFKPQIAKCLYEEPKTNIRVKAFIRKSLISSIINFYKSKNDPEKAYQNADLLMKELTAEIYRLIPLIKNSYFSDEQEWRITTCGQTNDSYGYEVKFTADSTQSFLKPYVEIDLPKDKNNKLIIDKIFISPRPFKNNQELTKKSLEMFLAKKGVTYNQVICSDIPYIEPQ